MPKKDIPDVNFYIGLCLAIISTLFIGSSFIVKKIALRRLSLVGTRAGAGGFRYLCDWVWWFGLILMGIGEAANFAGYAFAPASLVTPMGGLSVLVSAMLSSYFLGERLNNLGKIGCIVCLAGSTVVVLHASKEQEVQSLNELTIKFFDSGFLIYACAIIVMGVISIFLIAPRFGASNPLVFVFISGSIGSLSVMACKGIAIAIKQGAESGIAEILSEWIFWLCIFGLLICISVQLNYLNKALDIFNTSIVTPLLYVFFTAFVLIASAILFKETACLSAVDFLGNASGLTCIVCGIGLLTFFKDPDTNDLLKDVICDDSNQDLNGLIRDRCKAKCSLGKPHWKMDSLDMLLACNNNNKKFHQKSYSLLHNPNKADSYQDLRQGLHKRSASGAAVFFSQPTEPNISAEKITS